MISIEAIYCLTIGNFNNASRQFNLRTAVAVRSCMSSSRFSAKWTVFLLKDYPDFLDNHQA